MLKSCLFLIALLFPFFVSNAQTTGEISLKNKLVPETFRLHSYPVPAPTATFLNEAGENTSLTDFKGKIVLVNIWSTSCPQCVIELPMLDRLQKDMGGVKFQVIALSSDLNPLPTLKRFWSNRGIKHLKIYSDPQAKFAQAADVKGLPTTFLIDEEGREAGRIRGIVEWDGPKIKAQIRDMIRAAKQKALKKQAVLEDEKLKTSAESFPLSPENVTKEIQGWLKK